MIINTENLQEKYSINLGFPLDISIPLIEGTDTVNAFWAPPLQIEPVRAGNFVGDTRLGGAVNFKNVCLNPHGNGTHTECVGHIAIEPYTLNTCMKQFLFLAALISIYPQKQDNGDRVITLSGLRNILDEQEKPLPKALILRTLPNDELKTKINYSGSNPPYMAADAMAWLVEQGIEHLLIDLPSVDREEDGGLLAAHKAFWQYPQQPRLHCTISELVYVPNDIKDGFYLLNIMITSLELDASPSKPVLYALSTLQANENTKI